MKHIAPPTGTPIAGPELTQDSLSPGLAMQQQDRAEALQRLRGLRKEASDEIDRLLGFLDASDIDPDLEETGDDEEGADTEPSLGSFDRMVDQSKAWRQNAGELCFSIDAEQDDADNEPSLGSVGDVHLDQERWAAGNSRDLELDGAESGIADQDGLDEQVPFRDWQGVGMV